MKEKQGPGRSGAPGGTGRSRYWEPRELITIGTFAALIKVSTLMIALAGGGMNPVTMALKNTAATAMLLVLVFHVRKFGVLTLYVLVSSLVSLFLLGGNMMTIPGMLLAGLVCDGLIRVSGGYGRTVSLLLGVAAFDLLSRVVSLGYSYLLFREEPRVFLMGAIAVLIGYVGCLIGLPGGVLFVRELRHAGIVKQ
jgi:energy-coupling factor transport system substrate-specific component